ncbi:MAG: DUF4185 domain-containing protein [Pyrinomonadaceae bacterium]|nr:DUF4185 domain-containing protein [Pyrinomonadaceae bacterium]
MRKSILVFIVAVWMASPAVAADPPDLLYVPGSTEKVCQLTGDFDRGLKRPTLSQTAKRYGVTGTDLGSSFEHEGRLYFLFGDTKGRPGDWDAVAWTRGADPEKIVLDFHKGEDGKWLPPRVPGIEQGAFEIPSGGVSVAGTMYVVFTTDHTNKTVMGRSVLASSADDGRSFRALYDLSRDKFINVSICLADGWLYIYGSGEYRESSVCLARVRPGDLGDRSKLRYFAGTGPDGQARWAEREANATPLFRHDVVGEFSVAYLEPVKRYVMLYNHNVGDPRGIIMRSAADPSGPWSEGTVIFEPWRDGGYGHFMHISAKFAAESDEIGDPNRDETWGAEYGPYVMGRFTTGAGGRCRIYYTLSTWNPYQVVVMRSDLKLGPRAK